MRNRRGQAKRKPEDTGYHEPDTRQEINARGMQAETAARRSADKVSTDEALKSKEVRKMKIKFIANRKIGVNGKSKMELIKRNTVMEVFGETNTTYQIKNAEGIEYTVSKQADEIRKIDENGRLYR